MVQGPAACGQCLEAQGQTLEGFAAVVLAGTALGALTLPLVSYPISCSSAEANLAGWMTP